MFCNYSILDLLSLKKKQLKQWKNLSYPLFKIYWCALLEKHYVNNFVNESINFS